MSPAPQSAPVRVACVQVTAGRDLYPNLERATTHIRAAHAAGARMIFLPENVSMMEGTSQAARAKAMPEEDHVALGTFRALARELDIWLHTGTLAVSVGNGMIANRTYMLDPEGAIRARYDKIHMFDVTLAGGERYCESATFQPGAQAVVVNTPFLPVGLSVCYDVRFPHLFRALAQAGAGLLTVPAAFTQTTGKAHWHVLLRARAIENGAYVVAPAQTGTHEDGRRTFGHSLIISPWGEILADAGPDEGFIVADIDPARVAEVRGQIASLKDDRPFTVSVV
ncbi:carbon-nitrogen hydrolase family protein [Pararhodospirillum oryzae]|uniref:Amidohydrolase n=1 Tax=Pararhodospirillum oryzae TaxID=478448 RepID=A0A512H823_9PROT|nr:carbon-nitrogen hydrolase family protein [Pararhodospirillum oryzae]GEO81593.1 amidohydrolase [Pararhodospirillum oryzae]